MNNNNNNNSAFKKAREVKNDEFYTQLSDIVSELKHYKDKFRDKIVYLPCDNPEFSQFYYYFYNKFNILGLKKLICSFYSPKSLFWKNIDPYVTIVDKGKKVNKVMLRWDGSFDSNELIPYWKEADIIVTNPPFSIFQYFIDFVLFHKKDFILIGPISALRFKKVFLGIKRNKIFCKQPNSMKFISNDKEVSFGNICWFSSFMSPVTDLELVEYDKNKHLTYDNYDAINANSIHEIPNINKPIGVPITFLKYFNPDKYKIINLLHEPRIDNKCMYSRVIIKILRRN